jgi:hypothetical protein
MNGVKLYFEGSERDTGTRPGTFEDFVQLAERFFPHIQLDSAYYYDDEGDQVRIRTSRDLMEAYRLSDSWNRAQLDIYLAGKPLSVSFLTISQVQVAPETKTEQEPAKEVVPEEPVSVETVQQALEEVKIEVEEEKKPDFEQKFSRMRIADVPPEERYLICYKCNGDGKTKKGKSCRLCTGQGVINVATHPKFQRLTQLIREEIQSALSRINVPKQRIEIPAEGELHEGVTCDGCGKTPILGPRYKCSVCDNFDFCPECEGTKPHEHLFIKIRAPGLRPAKIVTVIGEGSEEPEKKRKVVQEPLACRNENGVEEGEWKVVGSEVKRVWKLVNPGRLWPAGCRFVNISGTSGAPIKLPQLGPGEAFEVEVAFSVPSQSGLIQSLWRAEDSEGTSFGDSFEAKIRAETQEEKTKRLTALLRDYMGRDPMQAASVLASCSGNIEEATAQLARLLA